MQKTISQIADGVLEKIGSATSSPTPEMRKHFDVRTKRHIALTQKYCKKIETEVPGYAGLIARGKVHDASKFKPEELEPYVWLTWRYKCKDDGVECKLPAGVEAKINAATEHHILNNAHHPEFHQKRRKGLLNKGDRDANPSKKIDATAMSNLDIAEMVADWCAMSEERGNTPREWADKVVNKRWGFTKLQCTLIYKLIDACWA